MKIKPTSKKRIELNELDHIKEDRKRVFELSYTLNGGAIRHHKLFQRKINVKRYLNDPQFTKIKIYVCDVL